MANVILTIEDAEHEGCTGIAITQEWDPPLIATQDGVPLEELTKAQEIAYSFLEVMGQSSDAVTTLEDVSVPIGVAVIGGRSNAH